MIDLNNLSIGYKDKVILSDISFQFKDQGLYAIIGESGCGKTTLLNTIGGILSPLKGEILYSEDIKSIFTKSVYIFQDNNLFDGLTVQENIRICIEVIGNIYDENKTDKILKKLKIFEYKNTKVSEISGGERQRVSIAIALLRDAKVIFADEPSSSLDEKNSKFILEILKELSKEILVIFTSHDKDLVIEYADTILDLDKNLFPMEERRIEDLFPIDKGKNKMKFSSLFFLHKKLMYIKKTHLVFSFLVFFCLLLSLAFFFSLENYSKEKVIARYLIDNNIREMNFGLWQPKKKYEIEEFEMDSYHFDVQKRIGLELNAIYFEGYTSKPITKYYTGDVFKNYIFDETLGKDEIKVTDYSLYALKYYNVIDFSSVGECIGKKIKVNNYFNIEKELIIKEIVVTDFLEIVLNNINYDYGKTGGLVYKQDLQYFLTNFWGNKDTYYDLTEDNLNDLEVYVFEGDSIGFEINSNWILNENEIVVSTRLMERFKLLGIEAEIGKPITLRLKKYDYDFEKEYSFIIKDIYESRAYHVISSIEMAQKLKKEFSPTQNGKFESYYITNFISSKTQLTKFISKVLSDDNYSIQFEGFSSMNSLMQSIDHTRTLAILIVVFALVTSILMIAYNTYVLYSTNRICFSILEVYGLKRINELCILSISSILTLITSAVFAGLGIFCINYAYDQYLKDSYKLNYIPTTYNFGYTISAILIVVGIMLLSLVVGFFISLKRKASSHIKNS